MKKFFVICRDSGGVEQKYNVFAKNFEDALQIFKESNTDANVQCGEVVRVLNSAGKTVFTAPIKVFRGHFDDMVKIMEIIHDKNRCQFVDYSKFHE
jgi:hypothetical protein